MDRDHIGYTQGEFAYIEYVNGERLRFKPTTTNATPRLEKAKNAYTLTEDELKWIRGILRDYNHSSEIEISPSYYYKKKTEYERNENREIVKTELDYLRDKLMKVTPKELLKLRSKTIREAQGIENFSGVYIIHNCVKDMYYVGQAKNIYLRANKHFLKNEGNSEVYKDYSCGDEFCISLIPLEKTSFSTLNDLEDNAIRAYESYPWGYNKMPGNILDRPIFKNEDYQKVAELILSKIEGTEWFLRISTSKERFRYTHSLLSEYQLPLDAHFITTFPKMIKECKYADKKRVHKK
ncbi:GIY-YIG nuclease family protein [Saliterribacillus persicus]|uniref:GIY-YIG catalytic domain-containing protein n=1 Tax=Saliterribacillus persicus TaxID=930114 RepID=A0A368Y830_9BACI|nr:GIY-YIG nuclease family protein [Saliterribacillus persicus]RCW74987.1 GIY-YIG catalytic domain-containing protein [Saliterribacillus persicus]